MKSLYVVQYEELDGTLKKKWYGGIRDARAGHKWFKKAAKLGKYQTVYPPMEEEPPEIDRTPETRKELIEFLNIRFRREPDA